MQFKYFEQPELFSSYIDETSDCDFCNSNTKCFDASTFIGEDSIKAICGDCLAGGKLHDKDISTCNGDITTLKQQLKKLNAELSSQQIDQLAIEKTNELEKTTPPLISWQDWDWPAAGGDYCIFIGYGSVPLYTKLAGKADPMKFFARSLYEKLDDPDEAEMLWDESMPEKEIKNYEESSECSTLFYVFKSLHTNKIVTIWDED
ncbi:MAG: CbrC family protein [Ferruginibacter sp.]